VKRRATKVDKERSTGSRDLKKGRKRARRLLIGASGSIVLSAGIAMIVLPGPAFVFIPLGLGILSTEFEWARKVRDRARAWLHRQKWAQDGTAKEAGSGRVLRILRIASRKGR
jgi:hypothetical protein